MKYIWINPVVMEMYKQHNINLEGYISELGFTRLEGDLKILDEVRNQFVEAVHERKGTVLDTRCPLAIAKVKEEKLDRGYYVPEIYPILIRTAFWLYEQKVKEDVESQIDIICPCQSLSDLGNKLTKEQGAERIRFSTWIGWAKDYAIPMAEKIGFTPIPLGFFKQTGLKVKELTGETLLNDLAQCKPEATSKEGIPEVEIIEMLYCKGGCHHGDGV